MAGTLTGSQAEQTVEEMVDDRESISPTQVEIDRRIDG